ncbi:MAG: Ig-like domain-containing protein [Clostridia bacterium]|nr:Ig-like domain-containing protein [Clostridia bacterium]
MKKRLGQWFTMMWVICLLASMLPTGIAYAEAHTKADRGAHPNCTICGSMTTTWGMCMGRGHSDGKHYNCWCWYGVCKDSGCFPDQCFVHKDGNCNVYGKDDVFGFQYVDKSLTTPKKVTLSSSGTVSLQYGSTMRLNATVSPSTADYTISWKSSSAKIATVDQNGIVTPVKEGTVTITAKTNNGKKATVKIKVVDPYKPTKVKLNQSGTVTVNRGSTLQLGATLEPSTAKSTLTWTSSKTKCATVNANGTVTANAEGTATITVKTHNGKKATVKVKVVDPYKPTKIKLNQSGTVTVNRGSTLQLGATLEPSTAQSTLTWKSSKTKYATVSGNGTVTAKAEGTTTITVKTHNGKKATVKVKVVDPYKPLKITLGQKGTITLNRGSTLHLSTALEPTTAQSELKWSSSKTKYATVDGNGNVTGKAEGTTTITVKTYNGKKATVKVKVVDPYKPTGVTLNQSGTASLETGKTLQLSATLSPSTAKSDLTWKSSNTKVAKVDANGLVTAVGKGTATITVTTHNGKKATMKVSVTVASSNGFELRGYFDTSIKAFVKKVGNMKPCLFLWDSDLANQYPGYTNDDITVGGFSSDSINSFELKRPSDYSVYGAKVGMTVSQADKLLRGNGLRMLENDGGEIVYAMDKNWIVVHLYSNGNGIITGILAGHEA